MPKINCIIQTGNILSKFQIPKKGRNLPKKRNKKTLVSIVQYLAKGKIAD
jgi:hypothetical protein